MATGVWLPRGPSYDIDGTELTWAANSTDDLVSDTHLAMFVAVNRTQDFGATVGLLTHRSSNAQGYFGLGYDEAQLKFFLHDGSLSEVFSGVDVEPDRGYHTYGVVREPGGAWTFVIDGVAVSGGTNTTIPGAASHALTVGSLQEGLFGFPAEYLAVYYWQGSPVKADHLTQLHADPFGPFRYARTARAFVQVAGEEESVTDGIVLGDSVTAVASDARSVTDGITLGDSVTATGNFLRSVTDGIKLGEDITTTLTIDSGPDGILLGDSVLAVGSFPRAVSDGIVLGDSVLTGTAFDRAITDGIALGDAAAEAVAYFEAVTDGIILGDSVARAAAYPRAVTDGLSLGDSVALTVAFSRAVTDGIVLGDSLGTDTGPFIQLPPFVADADTPITVVDRH